MYTVTGNKENKSVIAVNNGIQISINNRHHGTLNQLFINNDKSNSGMSKKGMTTMENKS